MAFLHPISKAVSDFKKVKKHGFRSQSSPSGYIYTPTNQFNQQNENSNKPPQGQTSGFFPADHSFYSYICFYFKRSYQTLKDDHVHGCFLSLELAEEKDKKRIHSLLSERYSSEKATVCPIPTLWRSEEEKTTGTVKRSVVARGCRGERGD